MKKYYSMLAILICFVLLAAGCGNNTEVKEKTEKDKKEEKVKYMSVGNEEDATYSVILKNTTGKNITGVSIKSSSETEYPVNMMKEGETWNSDEMINLFYTPVESDDQTQEATYSMQLTCEDQSVLEVMIVDFSSLGEKTSVCYDDSVPITYFEYKDKDGNKISTKEQEIAEKERIEAEAAAKAQAEAEAAAAEAAAQAQAEAEAAAAAEAAKKQQYNNAASTPSQNANQCLGGDALTY